MSCCRREIQWPQRRQLGDDADLHAPAPPAVPLLHLSRASRRDLLPSGPAVGTRVLVVHSCSGASMVAGAGVRPPWAEGGGTRLESRCQRPITARASARLANTSSFRALVAEPAGEALHAGVLGWLARRDVGPQGAGPVGRFQHGPRGQFGAVVADDHRETATPDDQRIEFARHPLAAYRAVDDQGERLAREVAHDRQNPAPPAQDSTSAAKRWSAACGMVIGARVPVARLRPRRRRTASPSSRYRR
jgi:hypothetical protein